VGSVPRQTLFGWWKTKGYGKGDTCVKQKKNPHRALRECPVRNKQLGISRRGMEYNIKMGLNEMMSRTLVNSPGSCKCGNIFGVP